MCTYFKTETAIAQNLINRGGVLKKTEALYAELNEKAEAATSC